MTGEIPSVSRSLRRNAPLLAVAVAGFLLLFWPTIHWLVDRWKTDPEFSHGFLVPIISVGILFYHRRELGALPSRRSLLGLALFLGSLAVFLGGSALSLNFPQRLGLIGALVGGVLYLFGLPVVLMRPFPYFFLLFSIPPPELLMRPVRLGLKTLVTKGSSEILLVMGIPAMPRGNVIEIGPHALEVADACSGIRSLLAIIVAAVLMSYLMKTGFSKGVVLTALALPVTIAMNILRIIVVAIGFQWYSIDLAEGTLHDFIGLALFCLNFACLFGACRLLEWLFDWEPREVLA